MNNIILLVWDACRFDKAESNAPYLTSLSEDNLKFTKAIAPAHWSFPSHVSIFTGRYPHEHGCCTPYDYISKEDLPLVTELNDQGYSTYGVSANKFAGEEYGFNKPFDTFYNTFPLSPGQYGFVDGLDILRTASETDYDSQFRRYIHYLWAAVTHDHPGKSLYNLCLRTARKVASKSERLETLHPLLHSNKLYKYSPDDNTNAIIDILNVHAGDSDPFFVFANYNDPHRPYMPPKKYQREILGDTLSFRELVRLNEDVAHPWTFLRRVKSGTIDEDDVELIRNLYRGEIRSVDKHLDQLMNGLEARNMRDDTLIIVTADHGENLGETDVRGERRMGHKESFTDALLNVPLVMIHPELEGEVVDQPVSLNSLSDVCRDGGELFRDSWREVIDVGTESDPVIAECPANYKRPDADEQFPGVPKHVVHRMNFVDTVVAYTDEWKVVLDSEGNSWVWKNKNLRSLVDAPDPILERCRDHVEKLEAVEPSNALSEMDRDTVAQLEHLGYI